MELTMTKFLAFTQTFIKDESGQDLIEYALVAGLIGLAAVTAMGSLGNSVNSIFTSVNNSLSGAV
jgi:pilus assembly protein Flp/PilA